MARETIVLGAGMVGVCTAYHLARRGRPVLLLDRRSPGQETSFGNAGLIQREAVQPYPFPRDIATLWRVLLNRSIGVRHRWSGVLASAGPLLRYWHHSAPERHARIVPEYASLIMRCTDEHGVMIEAAGAEALITKRGWLEAFRTPAVFDAQAADARAMQQRFGVNFESLDRAALQARVPALSDALIGAIHWTDTWEAKDPGALVQAYARAFESAGGRFEQTQAEALTRTRAGWRVSTSAGERDSEDLVVALGPWSASWLAPLGYRFPLFPLRGYHMHYAAHNGAHLDHLLLDFENGYVLAPMHGRVRLTTGAEIAPLDAPPSGAQLHVAEIEARKIFPLGERLDPSPWKGARPCLPDMKPVIGQAQRHPGLWFAFGHGHQGFTLGPLTGRLLGEMMDEETPAVDMHPFRADRF